MVAMCLNAVGIIAGKGLKNKENGLKNIYGGMYEKKQNEKNFSDVCYY